MTTKKQLLALLTLESFHRAMRNSFSHYETKLVFGKAEAVPVYKDVELPFLKAHIDGWTFAIFDDGRVTIDAGWSISGKAFDGSVTGGNLNEIQENGIATLRRAVEKSGLND